MTPIHNLKVYKKKRKYLRNNSTKTEIMLWQCLKKSQLGYKFRRQHSIKQYIVDFYCAKLKLILEIDGEVHNFEKQSQHDWKRERKLNKLGFKVMRIKSMEIFEDIDKVIDRIKYICDKLKSKYDQEKR